MKHPIVISKSIIVNKNNRYQGILASFLKSPAGLQSLSQAMTKSIRRNIDYVGLARRVIQFEQLPEGAKPIYVKKNFKHNLVKISNNGIVYYGVFGNYGVIGRRVTVPQFEIFSNPTIRLSDIKQRRFSLMERYQPTIQKHQPVEEIITMKPINTTKSIFSIVSNYFKSIFEKFKSKQKTFAKLKPTKLVKIKKAKITKAELKDLNESI